MKNLVPFFLFIIVLSSCNNENAKVEIVKPSQETVNGDTIVEVEIKTRSWIDSLKDFNVVVYTEMLDSMLYRNGNSRKMFSAIPKYTRCQDKKWKSAIVVDTTKNYVLYQTTNSEEEYKVMGYGYEPEYHERKFEDTLTFVKLWKLNDSVNLILTSSNDEVAGFSNELLAINFYEHSSGGLIDQTEKYLPKVNYEDFLTVSLDSAGLKKPPYLPLTYRMNYYDADVFTIEFNSEYVDQQKKHGKVYNWINDYSIDDKFSVDSESWKPGLYFKFDGEKFIRTDRPSYK
jgi:hypothetical protein